MWILIISLLLIGLALIVVEVIFVPGTTVVGIMGVICAGAGVIISYKHYGSEVGFYLLLGTCLVAATALVLSFRSGAWSRFANKSAINSKVNEGITSSLKEGDEGVALSTLKPIGKAQFGVSEFEVKTIGDYVDVGTRVMIISIKSNQVVVKPLTKQ
jgi:membrane-bound ClpP family serine protease